MSMSEWAKREIEILKSKNPPDEECGFDYIGECCDSAMRAFESLMNDGHSGMSIGITKNILMKLIEGKALTPIEDTPDVWSDIIDRHDDKITYQCKRMSSLFKNVYDDGRIEYHDVDRVLGVNINNPICCFHSGRTSKYVYDRFPITMPYIPASKPYEVYTEEFLTDSELSRYTDWNVEAYYYIKTPDGEKIELNEFYYYPNPRSNERIQITKEEFETLKANKKK